MASSAYHRKQAQVLAGLMLSTDNDKFAERMKLQAMRHLAAAELLDLVGALGTDIPNLDRVSGEGSVQLGASS
jgi:hypothetical protein